MRWHRRTSCNEGRPELLGSGTKLLLGQSVRMTRSRSRRVWRTSTRTPGQVWCCARTSPTIHPTRGRFLTRLQRHPCGCGLQCRPTIGNILRQTGQKGTVVRVATDDVRAEVRRNGYYVTSAPIDSERSLRFVLDLGRSLGDLYVPNDCDPEEPVIRTVPTRMRGAAPFNRAESIGWHGDFATHEDRPELSLVFIS